MPVSTSPAELSFLGNRARVLATDRGIRCVTLDYDALRGHDTSEHRLF